MKFRPLHDRVVVKRVEEDTKTKGGIIIPETAQEQPMQGNMIAVGHGVREGAGKLITIDMHKCDKTMFAKWSGSTVKTEGRERLLVPESDVDVVLEQ